MFGLILSVCLSTNPSCQAADWRTCTSLHICETQFIPGGPQEAATPQNCFRNAMVQMAKWSISNPNYVIKRFACGSTKE